MTTHWICDNVKLFYNCLMFTLSCCAHWVTVQYLPVDQTLSGTALADGGELPGSCKKERDLQLMEKIPENSSWYWPLSKIQRLSERSFMPWKASHICSLGGLVKRRAYNPAENSWSKCKDLAKNDHVPVTSFFRLGHFRESQDHFCSPYVSFNILILKNCGISHYLFSLLNSNYFSAN